jgi:hypothetical protein
LTGNIRRVLAGAAASAITLAGVGVAVTGAKATTPSCNTGCVEIFNQKIGGHFVTDSFKQRAATGNPIILWPNGNSDKALDFDYAFQGTVSQLYTAGLVSANVNLHYGSDEAVEFEYAPLGQNSGQCIGIPPGMVPGNGTKVALYPCGKNAGTMWILDATDSAVHGAYTYLPLINGADTNFSHPYVMSYPGSSYPTDSPRPVLQTWELAQYSTGDVYDTQMWSFKP